MEPSVDVLNRKAILNTILEIINKLSRNKESVTFAIDGEWGCGKSFLLNMLENELLPIQNESTSNTKYLILHYNCWKYDYYEEPLISVVSLLLEEIDNSENLFSEDQKARIKGILKAVGVNLISVIDKVIENKTGVDLEGIRKVVIEGKDTAADEIERNHSYDNNFSFNKALKKFQDIINKLSEKRTIVLIVNELDRCLPSYSIKVLERLHHLTEGTNNVITILATDKNKLEKNIEHIGFSDANQYLKKFISFEVSLDNGVVSKLFNDRIENYISLFDFNYTDIDGLHDYIEPFFSNIDMRNRIQLVDKAHLIHRMLFQNSKDEIFMLMELLLVILVDFYGENYCDNTSDIPFYAVLHNVSFRKEKQKAGQLIGFIDKKRKEDNLKEINFPANNPKRRLGITDYYGVFELMMCYWFRLHNNDFYYPALSSEEQNQVKENIVDLERFVELMKIIK